MEILELKCWNVFGAAMGSWSPKGHILDVWATTKDNALEEARKLVKGLVVVEYCRDSAGK